MKKPPMWLDRRICADGPNLALCLSEKDYLAAMKHCHVARPSTWLLSPTADATTHLLQSGNGLTAVVCLRVDPKVWSVVEIVGLLAHEATHVWQAYADCIGETHPGAEQEAYAVQAVTQELFASYTDQTHLKTHYRKKK